MQWKKYDLLDIQKLLPQKIDNVIYNDFMSNFAKQILNYKRYKDFETIPFASWEKYNGPEYAGFFHRLQKDFNLDKNNFGNWTGKYYWASFFRSNNEKHPNVLVIEHDDLRIKLYHGNNDKLITALKQKYGSNIEISDYNRTNKKTQVTVKGTYIRFNKYPLLMRNGCIDVFVTENRIKGIVAILEKYKS